MSEATDFSALNTLTALEKLWLQFAPIQNGQFLKGCKNLNDLDINWCVI